MLRPRQRRDLHVAPHHPEVSICWIAGNGGHLYPRSHARRDNGSGRIGAGPRLVAIGSMGDVVASCPRPSRIRAMSMIRSAAIALAGGMAIASGVASAPRQVALVEDVSGHPAGAGFMDYLEPGKIIR